MATKPPMTVELRNRLITTDVPNNGDALIYDASGNVWKPGPVSGSPSGAAGGDLAGAYPDPSVAGIRGVPVESGSPSHGDALLYDSGAGELRYAPPTSAGALPTPDRVGQMVWWDGLAWRAGDSLVTPGTPHPDDDEFEGGSLDASWTRVNTYAGPGIDQERAHTGADWYDDHNNVRKSWYLVQAGTSSSGTIRKPHDLAESEAIYIRFRADRRPSSSVAGDGRVDVHFTDEDFANRTSFVLTEHGSSAANALSRGFEVRSSGSAASTVNVIYSSAIQFEYACIQKTSGTFVLWLSENGNRWTRMLSFTPNGDVSLYEYFAISFLNTSSSPVNLIGGVDFVRFRPNVTQGVP